MCSKPTVQTVAIQDGYLLPRKLSDTAPTGEFPTIDEGDDNDSPDEDCTNSRPPAETILEAVIDTLDSIYRLSTRISSSETRPRALEVHEESEVEDLSTNANALAKDYQKLAPMREQLAGDESFDANETLARAPTASAASGSLLNQDALKPLLQQNLVERCVTHLESSQPTPRATQPDRSDLPLEEPKAIEFSSPLLNRPDHPKEYPRLWEADDSSEDHPKLTKSKRSLQQGTGGGGRLEYEHNPYVKGDEPKTQNFPKPTLDRNGLIESVYCGYAIEKTTLSPTGNRPSWAYQTYRRIRFESSAFRADAIKRARKLGTGVAQYDKVHSKYQKHINRLLEDLNIAEPDKRLEWVIASVNPISGLNRNLEYDEIHVIFKRVSWPLGVQTANNKAAGGKVTDLGRNDGTRNSPLTKISCEHWT